MTAADRPARLESLTGLRFVVASLIFVHHLIGVLWLPAGALGRANLEMGVSFFFCLSGFILYHSYASRDPQPAYIHFLVRRFLRLWPAHTVVFILSFFLFYPVGTKWFLNNLSITELAQILFLGQSWTPDSRVFWGVNAVSWSISVELFFYALFPILLLASNRRPAHTFVAVAILTGIYLAVAEELFHDSSVRFMATGLGAINPLPRVVEFLAGMLTAKALTTRTRWLASAAQPRTSHSGTAAELGVLALCGLCFWYSTTIAGWIAHPATVAHSWVRAVAGAPIFCLTIAVFAFGGGVVTRLLSTKAFIWLGNISFAEYLVHQRLIVYWQREIEPQGGLVVVEVATLLVAVLALSAAIYHFVEVPGIRLSKRLTQAEGTRPDSHIANPA